MDAPSANTIRQHETTPEGSSTMSSIVLINAFEVPPEHDEVFVRGWEAARDFLQRQAGYISTRLHQSLDPAARFRFINVAEWQSPAAFQAAMNHPEFAAMRQAMPFTSYPSLYHVVRT